MRIYFEILGVKGFKCLKSIWVLEKSLKIFSRKKGSNPLTPMSDQDKISPYNINKISIRQVMTKNEDISQGIISWSKPRFSD